MTTSVQAQGDRSHEGPRPATLLGSYRKEPLHSPVLPVGVSLCQRATVNGIAVKGVIKTYSERREMSCSSSSTSLELSVMHYATWVFLPPTSCGFGCITVFPSPGGWSEGL